MATTTLLTAADLLTFPETLHKPELVKGEVVEMAPVGGYHSDTQRKLAMLMGLHVDRGGLRRLGGGVGLPTGSGSGYGAGTGRVVHRGPSSYAPRH